MPRSLPPLRDAMRALFSDPRDKAFIFALEGVLVSPHGPRVPTPASADLIDLLTDLTQVSDGAVAILSDRSLDEVDHILSPLRLPGCGRNGLEIRPPDGPCVKRRIAADLDPVRRLFRSNLAAFGDLDVVDEGLALAFHHDGDPIRVSAAKTFAHDAVASAPAAFRAQFGDTVTRVTFAGASMGGAVRQIMSCDHFAERIPIVFGRTGEDDDVFTAARAFGATVVGIGATAVRNADIALSGPTDVHWVIRDFLAHHEVEPTRAE